MYETLLRLYLTNKLTDAQLENAVLKGWISESQKEAIIASKTTTTT